MTTNDIEQIQIIVTTKDGKHVMAVSKDVILINCIASWCQFIQLNEDLFGEVSLKELMENKT